MNRDARASRRKENAMAKTAEVVVGDSIPQITDLQEMPKARRGRKGMDLTPIVDRLRDLKEHALEGIADDKAKEKWARKIREAAVKADLEVRTVYDPSNKRLAFQGYEKGTAPAAGRKPGSKNAKKKAA